MIKRTAFGVTFKGASVQNLAAEQYRLAEQERMRQVTFRTQEQELARAREEASKQQVEQQRRAQQGAEQQRRIEAEITRHRISEEAASRRSQLPQEVQYKGPSTLPYFMAPETVARHGFQPDVVAAIHPRATAIGYPSNVANQRGAKHGADFIQTYQDGHRVIQAEVNPAGAEGYGRAHVLQDKPAGQYHFSKAEMLSKLEHEMRSQNGAPSAQAVVREVLALPEDKNFVTEAALEPGAYKVEISFAKTGAQQIRQVKPGSPNVTYSKTSGISGILSWLKGSQP